MKHDKEIIELLTTVLLAVCGYKTLQIFSIQVKTIITIQTPRPKNLKFLEYSTTKKERKIRILTRFRHKK